MVVDNVGISESVWGEKTFNEFKAHFKGKLRGDKIKSTWDKILKEKKASTEKTEAKGKKDKSK